MKKIKLIIILLLVTPLLGLCQTTYIVDSEFERYIEDKGWGDGISGNNLVNTSLINTVTNIYIDLGNGNWNDYLIKNFKGIEEFSSLISLDIDFVNYYNIEMDSLDLSQNNNINILNIRSYTTNKPNINYINLSNTSIENLDFRKVRIRHLYLCNMMSLENININNNLSWNEFYYVNDIIIKNNPLLQICNIYNSNTEKILIENNTTVKNIIIQSQNYLDSLSIKNNNQLTHLNITGNSANAYGNCGVYPEFNIELTNLISLTDLHLIGNNFSNVNLNNINNKQTLKTLDCSNNFLQNTDFINDYDSLEYLNLSNNNFSQLNIEHLIKLKHLNCSYNSNINYIDLSYADSLDYLDCRYTSIDSINCSKNTLLDTIYLPDTLSYLNVNNTSLTKLNHNNHIDFITASNISTIQEVNVRAEVVALNNNPSLEEIYIMSGTCNYISFDNAVNLRVLNCASNKITKLDLENLFSLQVVSCYNNLLTCLDISSNYSITYLNCENNLLERLNTKNGNWSNGLFIKARNNNLVCIQVDNVGYAYNDWQIDSFTSFLLDCNFIACDAVFGCTDIFACNYNPLATVEDSSCYYPNGCGDPMFLEYDPLVICSDSNACQTLIEYGCTDTLACNYNPLANVDDTTCYYPNGCGDPMFLEYDPLVICTDTNACQTLIEYGCTDPSACNYNTLANVNDTCIYQNVQASIYQSGDSLYAQTTPAGMNVNWYNVQNQTGTTRVWLMAENKKTFLPTFECTYYITLDHAGCSVSSEEYYFGATAKRIGDLEVSPNPSKDLVKVKFDNTNNQYVYLHLMDNRGIKLDDFMTKETELDIDMTKYPSGTYYLYFDSRFVKQGCNPEDVEMISTKIILNK